jgi:hypothetical protein
MDVLAENRIIYNKNNFQSEVSIAFLSHTENWQISNLLVNFSYFSFEISVLNMNEPSVFRTLKRAGSGSMGQVYIFDLEGCEKFAIKSIPYTENQFSKNKDSIQRNLAQAIKEYCLNKLCSVL